MLGPVDGGRYFDGTLGGGGHARAVLEASAPGGELAGTDLDPAIISKLQNDLAPFAPRAHLFCSNFTAIDSICNELGWESLQGIVLDLGLSSFMVDDAERGFAFSKEGRLDMRFSPTAELEAHTVVNTYSEEDLTEIIKTYGEERFAPRIARAIIKDRPLETTTDLAECIARAIPRRFWPPHTHPATRTFQAIRMEVNQELESLKEFLPKAAALLAPGGVMAIISFHSLEDRIVKRFFAPPQAHNHYPPLPQAPETQGPVLERVVRKSLTPGMEEISNNPRSRSARLRAVRRIA